jgi:exodeoxyribonuclease VIII
MAIVAEAAKEEKALEPGLYRGIDFDTYAEWPAVNASILNGFSRTPAHVYYEMTHGGKKRTPSLDLGWYVHLAILEPERFEAEVIVPPKLDKRTKVGKAEWAKFEAANAGKLFVDAATHEKVTAMAESMRAHETAREFFSGKGQNEISIVWEDGATGLLCKARIDRVSTIGEWPIVGDVKSARNASRREFERSIHLYGYAVQAVHYLAGLETLYPIPDGAPFRRFVFFVVESEPPYCCACYELDDIALQEGELLRRKYLRAWKECTESGSWPGYAQGIDYASLPPWALKQYQTD